VEETAKEKFRLCTPQDQAANTTNLARSFGDPDFKVSCYGLEYRTDAESHLVTWWMISMGIGAGHLHAMSRVLTSHASLKR